MAIIPPSSVERRVEFKIVERRSGGRFVVGIDAESDILIRRSEVQKAIDSGEIQGVML
jgi:sRNA-binding carbon storage regulator CsrA